MQNQALPVSLLEASNADIDRRQNEVSLKCRSCGSGRNGGMIETIEAMIVSPDCFCTDSTYAIRPRSSPASLPSWNCTLKCSRSSLLAEVGAAPEALRQQIESRFDEEEDGLMFDFEI